MAALALAGAQTALGGVIVAHSGNVRGELTYAKKDDANRATGLHLRIVRAGQTLLDRDVTSSSHDSLLLDGKDLFQVRDLDGDKEPEVLLGLFTGGAHCCSYTLIWRYRPDRAAYVRTRRFWGNPGYRLVDLDGDGVPEFRSGDDRFSYAFTAYAFSFRPVRIWRYRNGIFADVTRSYPQAITSDLASLRREYRRLRGHGDLRGLWAAYLADDYLLGRNAAGWRAVRAALRRGELRSLGPGDSWPSRKLYLTALRDFLLRLGYAR